MYYLTKMCCSCLCPNKDILTNFKHLDDSLIKFYNFFITKVYTVTELNTTCYYICKECLMKIEYCYEFWKQCIKSKNILYSYIFDLKNTNDIKINTESNLQVFLTKVNHKKRKHKQKLKPIEKIEIIDDDDTEMIDEKSYKNDVDNKESVKSKEDLMTPILDNDEENKFMKLVDNFSHLVDELEQYDKVDKKVVDIANNIETKHNINDEDDDDDDDEDAMYIDLECDPDKSNNSCDNLDIKKPSDNSLYKEQSSDRSNFIDISTTLNSDENTNGTIVKNENKEENYQCTICLKQLPTLFNLEKHKLIHSNSFPLKCPYCQKKFTYIKYVLLHENAYIEEKFKCIICYKILCSPTSFEKHKKYHELSYKCNDCHQTFAHSKTLKEHRSTKHYNPSQKQKFNVNSIKKANKKIFTCLTCGKRFKDKIVLEKHELQHTQNFKCNECHLLFKDILLLNSHINSTHTSNFINMKPEIKVENDNINVMN